MSASLFVTQTRSIELQEVASEVGDALQGVLSLSRRPIVRAIFDVTDGEGDPSRPSLSSGSCRVLCSLDGYPEQILATPLAISYGTWGRDLIDIRWQMYKSPLCFAFQAAAALGLAQWMNSTIEDNAGFFTVSNESTPTEFVQAVKLTRIQTDIRSAADEFFNRLPMGGRDSGWKAYP
jgi:hypothetical protein